MPTRHGHDVRGVDVDEETRCEHYHDSVDVIAIRFPCCDTYYPCFECHEAVADHAPERIDSPDAPAVLCGVCGEELTAAEYLAGDDECPDCGAAFNPGCRTHYHLYFDPELRDDGNVSEREPN